METRSCLSATAIHTVQQLLDAATAVDGVTPLDEGRWLDLGKGRGFTALLVWEGEQLAAYGHLRHERPGPQHTSGQPASPHQQWSLAAAIDPRLRLQGRAMVEQLAAETARIVAESGGGELSLWASQPRPDHEALAAALGLRAERSIYQMRRPLPVGEAFELTTRAFRPGVDERPWLEVNNRAFAWHPEQSGWDLETIESHEALPWFDPAGFLIYEVEGRMAGFCWTKVHAEHDPPMGEIYVIATDPDFAGAGLGRRLTLAGLDHLAGAGMGTGMLYVDADNRRAVKLYIDLGFVVHHVDVDFSGAVT
jgi:mycothiol synthase